MNLHQPNLKGMTSIPLFFFMPRLFDEQPMVRLPEKIMWSHTIPKFLILNSMLLISIFIWRVVLIVQKDRVAVGQKELCIIGVECVNRN
jgi:hypothetical protein